MTWITDEANEDNERRQSAEYRNAVIAKSNYWAALLRQVEADVKTINEHPYWKPLLAGVPLHFNQELGGSGYQVSKSGFPAVTITFRNLGDRIEIERDFVQNEDVSLRFEPTEELFISTSGSNVVLQGEGKRNLGVPQDASQYILKPVIESLKATKV